MYTEKGSFGISMSHLWTDYWIDFVAWPMISFCSDEPGVTAHICIRSYKTGRSLPHIYIYKYIHIPDLYEHQPIQNTPTKFQHIFRKFLSFCAQVDRAKGEYPNLSTLNFIQLLLEVSPQVLPEMQKPTGFKLNPCFFLGGMKQCKTCIYIYFGKI